MTEKNFSLALPADSMWQKLIAKRVLRRVELTFTMLNGVRYSGWVTGLDEEWVQITDRDLHMHCLSLANLVAVSETGVKFYELDFSEEDRKRFDVFTNRFRQACESELRRVGDTAYSRPQIVKEPLMSEPGTLYNQGSPPLPPRS